MGANAESVSDHCRTAYPLEGAEANIPGTGELTVDADGARLTNDRR
ncbi:MAG: hypothetical protein OXP69_19185 [Spirochaetaceae bacterium]|nr:hypothetical protein [Spirochaetaceae bacterium]